MAAGQVPDGNHGIYILPWAEIFQSEFARLGIYFRRGG
jgi:hypothetical protein